MKVSFNLTSFDCDLSRFKDSGELSALLKGFDGVELMYFDEDTRGILESNRVLGLHADFSPYWVDFYNGDERALVDEFGSLGLCCQYYGGLDKSCLIARFKHQLALAERFGAEYIVFHISDVSTEETFTGLYSHTDEQVIDASVSLINEVFDGYEGNVALLMENLWTPGLTLLRPDMTERLLRGVKYQNKGIMFDTGHLMHTHTKLYTQREALAYLERVYSLQEQFAPYFRGMHLHQSLTGEYMENVRSNPPKLMGGYYEKLAQSNLHVLRSDCHKPFICEGVKEFVEHVNPEYLTFEFITESLEQHKSYLRLERAALGMEE